MKNPCPLPSSFLIVPLLLACGCSSSPSSVPADGGGDAHADGSPAVEGGPPDAGSDTAAEAEAATVCNTLANDAPAITVEQTPGTPPASTGGTIVDGTYWLTAATIYTGAGDPPGTVVTGQTTIRIAGSVIEVAGTGEPPTRTTSIATSGTSFTATDTCPDTGSEQGSYTATATTFVVELPAGTDDAGAKTLVETFTKQ